MATAFSSWESSFFLDMPATPLIAMPTRHASKERQAGTTGEQFAKFAIKDRWHKRAESSTKPKSHRHAESNPQLAHRETKSEAADAPNNTQDVGPNQRRARCGGDVAEEVKHQQAGQHRRGDNPTEDASDDPIGLPGPSFHAAIGNVETGGCEATEPVEEDAECEVYDVIF